MSHRILAASILAWGLTTGGPAICQQITPIPAIGPGMDLAEYYRVARPSKGCDPCRLVGYYDNVPTSLTSSESKAKAADCGCEAPANCGCQNCRSRGKAQHKCKRCGGSTGSCGCDTASCDAGTKGCDCGEDSCGCESNSCGCGCDACASEDCGEPWALFNNDCRRVKIGGWLSAGITFNSHGNRTQVGNSQLGFNNDPNLNLNQGWLYAERATDTGGCGFDWGFRVDGLIGVDAQDTQAFADLGWDSDWQWGNGQYGGAIPQAYLEIAYDDLTVKLGHFYTIIGYEVVQAPDNFFYSHSYTQYYGEPFTHTGFLVDYALSDQVSVSGGWTAGWDSGFYNVSDASTFLGGISWTSCDENTSLAYAVSAGDWGNARAGFNAGDIYMHSIVFSQAFGEGLTYVLQSDYGNNSLPGQDAEWYGVNQYLLKEINCCWAIGGRFEWFRDDDAARVDRAFAPFGAAAANYYAATVGINWKPHTNLTFRPEVRYDWTSGGGPRFDPVFGNQRTYRKNDMFTFGIDGIFTF